MGTQVAMVSNGVNQERTSLLLGIERYFDSFVGSIHVGHAKPDPEIFQMALSNLGIGPEDAIMVGDNWKADILGARGVEVRGIHLVRSAGHPSAPDAIEDLHGVFNILNI